MNEIRGTFVAVGTPEYEKQERERQQMLGGNWKAMPTLAIGEVVAIKGVDFRVIRMKLDGHLGLKMIPTGKP